MPRKSLFTFTTIYILACCIYFIWSLAVTEPGYPLDDSWIHQVFARNIITGNGFSFNPGQPVSGATAPLWTLIMAVVWPVMGPIAAGIILGVLLVWLALIAIYRVSVVLTDDPDLAFLILMACAVCWPLIWGALSGMEVGLYSALSLWGLYFYLRAKPFDDSKYYFSYLFFALSFLARPECALFLAAAVIRDFLEWKRLPAKNISPWLWRGLIIIAVLLPYFLFNYHTTGSIFTQTFNAKVQGRGLIPAAINGDIKHIAKSLTFYPFLYLQDFLYNILLVSPILFFSFIPGTIKLWAADDGLKSKRRMLVVLIMLYVPLMGTFAPVLSATYHNMRLVDNIIPLFLAISLTGFFWQKPSRNFWHANKMVVIGAVSGCIGGMLVLADDFIVRHIAPYLMQDYSMYTSRDFLVQVQLVSGTGRNLVIVGFIIIFGIFLFQDSTQKFINRRLPKFILLFLLFLYFSSTLLLRAPNYANDVKNVNDMDKAIGLYLGRFDHRSRVAVGDIGAIAYFSGMQILDLKGLVSPQLTSSMIQNDSLAFEYMLDKDRVDYLAIFPAWFRYITTRTDILEPIKYFVVDCNTILADDTTIVYRAHWPDSTR